MKYEITLDVIKKIRDIVEDGYYDPENFRFAKFDLEQACGYSNRYFFKVLKLAMDHYVLKCGNVPLFDIQEKDRSEGNQKIA